MAVDIDSLQIEIEATSSDAAAKIDALATALTNLKAAAKGGAGLTTVSKQMQALASAAASLNNTGIGKLRKIAPALNALSSVQKSSGLSSTVNALSKLSSVSESLKGNSIKEFASQMNQVASAIRPLATEMQKVSNGFSAFPIRIQKIIQSNTGLATSNNKAAKSFGVLGTGISSTTAKLGIYYLAFQRVANMASDWVKSANDYIENVNLFQVSMGEFYDEAFAYAEILNDRLGIDPSEWMRAQGVFMSMANGFGLARQQAYDLSEGLTELAYDLSSLYNEDVSESILRLQSALSGEIEPIRRLGISISQATLQEYALAHGIDESVISMTEQEKALLRSLVLMEGAGRIGAIGDFAKTLESPANALRVLRQQITQLGRAIGTALLPIIIQIIPWVQAFVEVLTDAIKALATFLGFTMPEWETSDWATGITDGALDAEDAIGGATSAAKEMRKALLGIDELTILEPSNAGGSGGVSGGSGWASDLEIPNIWDKNAIIEIQTKADELKKVLEEVLYDYVLPIGTALAAWKIAKTLSPELKALNALLSGLMIYTGISLIIDGITEVLFGDGLTWESILNGGAGGLLAGAGVGSLLAKKIGLTWTGGMLVGGLVGLGLTLTVMSIIAQIKDGLNLGNTMLNAIGAALAGGALGGYFAFRKNLNPAQGVIGGLTAGIGISLLISSIISIAKDGLNIVNGIMGAIGGALAGFGIGMIFGGGAGAAIGLVIGVGVSFVIEGITAQIGGGAPSLSGGIMTILGSALAGAGIGSLVPVVGTAAGAVIGFGVGVVLEIIGIKEAAKVAYEASEDFQIMQDILDRCTDASSRTSSAMDSLKNEIADLDATVANYGIARQLADDIFDINENANASAYELQQMAVKVDVLNGLNISGLRLSIDETNGRVIETRASVEQLIESLEQEARYEAMRDILVQTYKDQYQAMLDVKQATQDYNAANEALMNTTQELNDTPWYNLSRREELKLAQEKETEALEAANRVREDANELIDISWGKSENLIQMMLELKESEAGIGDGTVEGLVHARAEMDDFLDEYKQSSKWSSIGEGIGTGVSNGIAKKKSAIRGALDSALSGMKSIFSSNAPQKKSGRIFSEMPEVKTINLNAYATGGFPNYGEMFIAREQGPELVGRIGNRTAVANNDQIVEGVAAGVTSANDGVINAIYAMAQQIIAAIEENGGDVYLDGDKVGKQVTAYQNRQNRMYGKTLQRI